jgi:hypothetical protein
MFQVINKKVFVSHGGIPYDRLRMKPFTPEDMNAERLDRKQYNDAPEPFGSLTNEQLSELHGNGIIDALGFDKKEGLEDRMKELGLSGLTQEELKEELEFRAKQLAVNDLLWADPTACQFNPNFSQGSVRGCFGTNVAEKFLKGANME